MSPDVEELFSTVVERINALLMLQFHRRERRSC
jgi:hypothetical protein